MKNLFIIDDDELIHEMVSFSLAPLENRMMLRFFQELGPFENTDPPDIILSDLRLRNSKGEDTLKKIRSLFPSVPLIVMSGVEPLELEKWRSDYALAAFILKDDLLHRLKSIIDSIGN